MPRADRLARLLPASILAVCALAFVRTLLLIPAHIPLNYNEGWNAFHSADLAAHRALYPDPPAFFFNNYPPLSFFATAPLGHALGDHMVAGRIVASLAFAAWVLLTGVAARRLRGDGVFGAMLLAVCMFVFSDFYVGVNDPQILGHALQMLGLVVLLRPQRTTGSVAAAAVLLAAGVFIKNNLIALPLAATLWLLATDRVSGWKLIAFGAAAGVAGAAVSVAAFGPQFAAQVLYPREILPAKAVEMFSHWLVRMSLPLAATAWLAFRRRGDRHVQFVLIYLACAFVLGSMFSFGAGVFWNTLFDADCALALAASLAVVEAAAAQTWRLAVPAAFLAGPLVALSITASIHWLSPRFWFDPRWSDIAEAGRDIDFVRRAQGPALCENLAVCYWAGKSPDADFFNLRERARREPWRIDALRRRVEAREFAVAQIGESGLNLGPGLAEALRRNYREDHADQWGVFWLPK